MAMPMGGSNQYMSYPGLPNFNASSDMGSNVVYGNHPIQGQPQNPTSTMPTLPGASYPTPPHPGSGGNLPFWMTQQGSTDPWINLNAGQTAGTFWMGSPGGKMDMGGSVFTAPTFDPQMTNQYYSMLGGLMAPSQYLQGDFMSMLAGGANTIPGGSQLQTMAQTGDPITATPEWQATVQAMQQNIAQNQAALKEQFGAAGELQSSPFGNAMSNYMQQTTLDQNALLAQLQQQSLEAAMGRQQQTGLGLAGLAGNEQQFLSSLFSSGATASPGLFSQNKGSVLGGIGSMIGAAGALGGMSTGGGGTLAGDLLGMLGL